MLSIGSIPQQQAAASLTVWPKTLTAITAAPTSPATSSTEVETMRPISQGGELASADLSSRVEGLGAKAAGFLSAAGCAVAAVAGTDTGGLAARLIPPSEGELPLPARPEAFAAAGKGGTGDGGAGGAGGGGTGDPGNSGGSGGGGDAVMIGSPIARAAEAPGRGFHWGMATPSPVLPRGTRIKVGTTGSLERILRGPANLDDGTQNLLGCIRTSMGTLGARTIKEMQQVEVVVAPSLLTEGKVYQKAQHLGMGK